MHIDKLGNESVKHSEKRASEIDKYLFGDDNELDQNELVKGFETKSTNNKKWKSHDGSFIF